MIGYNKDKFQCHTAVVQCPGAHALPCHMPMLRACPCAACLHAPSPQVALKQVPNVLGSVDNAKRVLRETAILRRLRHPKIVGLRDVFLKPSDTGGCCAGLCWQGYGAGGLGGWREGKGAVDHDINASW